MAHHRAPWPGTWQPAATSTYPQTREVGSHLTRTKRPFRLRRPRVHAKAVGALYENGSSFSIGPAPQPNGRWGTALSRPDRSASYRTGQNRPKFFLQIACMMNGSAPAIGDPRPANGKRHFGMFASGHASKHSAPAWITDPLVLSGLLPTKSSFVNRILCAVRGRGADLVQNIAMKITSTTTQCSRAERRASPWRNAPRFRRAPPGANGSDTHSA